MKNIFKIASLLAAAVMLFACQKAKTEDGLVITADRDVLQSDGKHNVTLKVLFRGKDATAESLFYDETDALKVEDSLQLKMENISSGQHTAHIVLWILTISMVAFLS